MKNLAYILLYVALTFACALSSGCAPVPYRPVIDQGAPLGNYDADMSACTQLAQQRPAGNATAGGAAVGAIFGALLGAAVGLRGANLGQVAAAGAVSGGAQGAGVSMAQQRSIIANCMSGRGYNVVGG